MLLKPYARRNVEDPGRCLELWPPKSGSGGPWWIREGDTGLWSLLMETAVDRIGWKFHCRPNHQLSWASISVGRRSRTRFLFFDLFAAFRSKRKTSNQSQFFKTDQFVFFNIIWHFRNPGTHSTLTEVNSPSSSSPKQRRCTLGTMSFRATSSTQTWLLLSLSQPLAVYQPVMSISECA